jgi:glutamate/tyrosine decarboxylase-like PLP-dependent enzyme
MLFNENLETWNELTKIIQEYTKQNSDRATPVVNYESAKKLKSLLNLNLSQEGVGKDVLLDEIRDYLKYSVRTTHPQFNNQLQAGANFESLLGEVISFITNTTMATFEVAPVASLMEAKLVDELCSKIGYTEGGGIMLTGGSNANLLALHCARNTLVPEIKYKGNQGIDLCIFVSEEAHYSFKKAVMLMGMGLDNLILIDCDKSGKMIPTDLEAKIISAKKNGKKPIMIASTCGTTVKGAFDPIQENQLIADKYELWHHIDGAWGGAALFSDLVGDKLSVAHKADSFTFDAHKVLSTGIITSFLLTKREGAIAAANSGGGSEYLFHHYENADYDTGKSSLQCGRKVDALKLWLSWKSLGHKGMTNYVDNQIQKMQYFRNLVVEHPRLNLVCEPEYLNVCFQVVPCNKSLEIDQYNIDLRFKMVKAGKFLVNFSSDKDGTFYFRLVFANGVTEKEDILYFIEELLKLAN